MKEIGTVISTFESPSSSKFSFVIKGDLKKIPVRKGQFVQLQTEEGDLIARVAEVIKTNRYLMRAESVREYERSGRPLPEIFPTERWEYLVARATPLGIFADGRQKRVSFPPSPGSKVFLADESVLTGFLGLDKDGLNIGKVEFHDLETRLNLTKLFQKHCSILAQTGAGKCLSYDTEIMLADGNSRKIGELFDEMAKKHEIKFENGVEYIELQDGINVLTLSKNLKLRPKKTDILLRRRSPEKIIKIKLWSGKEIFLTHKHPLLSLTKRGIKWLPTSSLNTRDRIATSRFLPINETYQEIDLIEFFKEDNKMYADISSIRNEITNKLLNLKLTLKEIAQKTNVSYCAISYWLENNTIPLPILFRILKILNLEQFKNKINYIRLKHTRIPIQSKIKMDEKFAKFLGYVFAESHNSGHDIRIDNLNKEILEEFIALGGEIFGLEVSIDWDRKVPQAILYSKTVAYVLNRIFGVTKSSRTKNISRDLIKSPLSVLRCFLEALIDGDGHVNKEAPELEISFSNKISARQASDIFLRFGIISRIKPKKRLTSSGTHEYPYLYVRGSENLKKLNDILELKTIEKTRRLNLHSSKDSNPNIDLIPNIGYVISRTEKLLRISSSKLARYSRIAQVGQYIRYKKSPSRKTLLKIVHGLEKRIGELKDLENLIDSIIMPKIDRERLVLILSKIKNENNVMYKTIAQNCDVTASTVRRCLTGLTEPTDNIFNIVRGMNKIFPDQIFLPPLPEKTNLINTLEFVRRSLNISCRYIDKRCYFSKGRTQSYLKAKTIIPSYENLWRVSLILKQFYKRLEKNLSTALMLIGFLKNLALSDVFWEPIVEIKKIESKKEFVYDIAVKGTHNFLANNIIVHNSYLVSNLIEEILDREEGKPAIIIVDPHGEYLGFAEDEAYVSKTNVFDKKNLNIATYKLSASQICEFQPFITSVERRELSKLIKKLKEQKEVYDLNELITAVEMSDIRPNTKAPLISWLSDLNSTGLFGNVDSPGIEELAKSGQLSILDLSDFIHLRDKQIIVTYIARKLFEARRLNKIPPFIFVVEEAHQFAPEVVKRARAISKSIIETIAREGRKFNASLVLISQRPIQLSVTALSQCNSSILLRIVNPYDLDHVAKSCEGITRDILQMLPGLKVGEAIITGAAINYPLLIKIRERKSKESTKIGIKLEDAALSFVNQLNKSKKDLDAFM